MSWAQAAPVIVTAVLAVAGTVFVRRHGGGTALEELERANRILVRRVRELEGTVATQAEQIAALTATRDVSIAIAPVIEAMTQHEERAAQRGERHAILLQMIADRMPSERFEDTG